MISVMPGPWLCNCNLDCRNRTALGEVLLRRRDYVWRATLDPNDNINRDGRLGINGRLLNRKRSHRKKHV